MKKLLYMLIIALNTIIINAEVVSKKEIRTQLDNKINEMNQQFEPLLAKDLTQKADIEKIFFDIAINFIGTKKNDTIPIFLNTLYSFIETDSKKLLPKNIVKNIFPYSNADAITNTLDEILKNNFSSQTISDLFTTTSTNATIAAINLVASATKLSTIIDDLRRIIIEIRGVKNPREQRYAAELLFWYAINIFQATDNLLINTKASRQISEQLRAQVNVAIASINNIINTEYKNFQIVNSKHKLHL